MLERGSTDQIVSQFLRGSPPECDTMSGDAIGYPNCFTAFLILTGGGGVTVIVFLGEVASSRVGAAREEASSESGGSSEVVRLGGRARPDYEGLSRKELGRLLEAKDAFIAGLLRRQDAGTGAFY